MLIGSHVSMKAPKMLLGAAQEAASYQANTFMIYTGAPQNTRRKDISEMNIAKGNEFIRAHHMSHIVVHAPYIVNLGNTVKPQNFALESTFYGRKLFEHKQLGPLKLHCILVLMLARVRIKH